MEKPTSRNWMTIPELADHMNVKESWVRDWVSARKLPHHRPGGQVRFTPADIAAIDEMFAEPAITETPSRAAGRVRRAARRPVTAANAA